MSGTTKADFANAARADDIVATPRRAKFLTDAPSLEAECYRDAPAMIHAISAGGEILSVNHAWARALGYDRDAVLGRALTEFVATDQRGRRHAAPLGFWRDGRCDAHPLRLRAACGRILDLEAAGAVDNANGGLRGVFVLTDVSARNAALARLMSENEALALRNRSLDLFAWSAAHDLKAPLRALAGYGDLLTSEHADALPPDAAACVERMKAATARIDGLLDALLAFARAPHAVERARTDLTRVAETAVDACAVAIADAEATVSVAPLPTLSCDRATSTLLMENLVRNAVAHRSPGRAPRIDIGARRAARRQEIFVRDNGVGVDPAHAERIFEPFTRLSNGGAGGGSGLGLAICRRICDAHDWRIRLAPARAVGAEFVIEVNDAR